MTRVLTEPERAVEASSIETRYGLPSGIITVEQRGAAGRPRRFSDDEIAIALEAHGSARATARALGCSDSTVREAVKRLAARGDRKNRQGARKYP